MFKDKPYIQDNGRITKYKVNEKLLSGEAFDVFKQALFEYYKTINPDHPDLTYIAVNFFAVMSKKTADIALGEGFSVSVQDNAVQQWLDAWMQRTGFLETVYNAMYFGTARGDMVFKASVQEGDDGLEVYIDEVDPAVWYPDFTGTNVNRSAKVNSLVHAVEIDQHITAYLVETYGPEEIRYSSYINDTRRPASEGYQKVDPSLYFGVEMENLAAYYDEGANEYVQDVPVAKSLVYHVKNMPQPGSYFGASDYKDIKSLIYAVNQRLTANQANLNDLTDPLLFLPAGTIDKVLERTVANSPLTNMANPTVNPLSGAGIGSNNQSAQDAMNNARIAKDVIREARLTEASPDGTTQKPEFITWDGNLENSFNQIKALMSSVYLVSEIAPVLVDTSQNYGQLSGTALRILAQPTLKKAQRKLLFMQSKLAQMLKLVQELAMTTDGLEYPFPEGASVQDVTITFRDGLINDEVETANVQNIRLANGTQDRAGAVAVMDGVSIEEANKKVQAVDRDKRKASGAIEVTQSADTQVTPTVALEASTGVPVQDTQTALAQQITDQVTQAVNDRAN